MDTATRRGLILGSTALPLAGAATAAEPADAARLAAISDDLARYIGFGAKASGGAGDIACGEWLGAELARAGFAVERTNFSAPWFEPEQCRIQIGDHRAPLWPQPIVVQTPAGGVAGPLVRVDAAGRADAPLAGAIALVDLPYGRWSSTLAAPIRTPVNAAIAAGARAVAIITNGPTGKAIALNADGRAPMFSVPTGVLAPADAAPFLAAAMQHAPATLTLTGRGGRRPAFNLIGRIVRGDRPWIVVSTPRSGWFACAGERGGGIATWLELARWAPAALPAHNLAFLCNSGHEYENLGAQEALREAAPRPAETAFWLHLGANLAARDWHEGLLGFEPLPGADSQRYLVLSERLLPEARRLFAGLPGLENPYPSTRFSAGELTAIIAAGYPTVAGVFGVHRFHHVAEDDARCAPADAITAAAQAFRGLLAAAV